MGKTNAKDAKFNAKAALVGAASQCKADPPFGMTTRKTRAMAEPSHVRRTILVHTMGSRTVSWARASFTDCLSFS